MPDREEKFVPPEEMGDKPTEGKKTIEQTSADFELPREVIEKIMEKVQDINAEGTAFSQLIGGGNLDKIRSLLVDGYLAQDHQKTKNSKFISKEQYLSELKPNTDLAAFFNVVGRYDNLGRNLLRNTSWIMTDQDAVVIIFDKSKYKEVAPPITQNEIDNINNTRFSFDGPLGRTGGVSEIALGSYFQDFSPFNRFLVKRLVQQGVRDEQSVRAALAPRSHFLRQLAVEREEKLNKLLYKKGWRDEAGAEQEVSKEIPVLINNQGEVICDSDHGFALKGRIKPRTFMGIAVRSPDTIWSIVKIQAEVSKNNPELLLPVYNIKGDLHWPKEMEYEEVQQFVVEREARKDRNNKLSAGIKSGDSRGTIFN